MYAPTAVHAQMFARLKQFIPNNTRLPGIIPEEMNERARLLMRAFLFAYLH
jgi:hypothetical protein